MKILVTGASGLLGSEICRSLEADRESLKIQGLIRLRRGEQEGFLSVDLAKHDDWNKVAAQDWDVMIHTAAVKDPERCEDNREEAVMLNVAATSFLSSEAARRGAYFIYICTDYVFPGVTPPYGEDAQPAPINYYGLTKRQGELAVLTASETFVSLRVPILYGLSAGIEQSGALIGAVRALVDRRPQQIEDEIVRYLTWTGSVAAAVKLLLSKRPSGIFHCTAEEKTTKYGLCVVLAEMLGLPYDHLRPRAVRPGEGTPRPHDAHLSWQRLRTLGFPGCKAFSQQLPLLKDEIVSGIDRMKKF